ncbi:MAG: hypothetical protein HC817_06345 [Saprospiraceae bacterium]|nr:hypothetical protein [Saprospiraceae bacterium]
MIGFTLLTSLIFIGTVYIFREAFASLFSKESEHFLHSLPYILGFTVIIAFASLYTTFASIYNRIVVPSLLQNLLIKIAQPILILLFAYSFISFADVFKGLTFALCLMLGGLILYFYILNRKNTSSATQTLDFENPITAYELSELEKKGEKKGEKKDNKSEGKTKNKTHFLTAHWQYKCSNIRASICLFR